MPDIKTKPKLYINIFSSDEFDWECLKIDSRKQVIYVQHLFDFHSPLNKTHIPKFWCFKSDKVFSNCCQDGIYKTVIGKVHDNIYDGVDNVLMSYGQNYSGKTFTMSGLYNQFELRGIVPRFVTDMFAKRENLKSNISTQIWISAVDVFQNLIYDLFSNPVKGCKDIKEVKKVKVNSEVHCLQLLFQAESRRMTLGEKAYNSHIASNVVTFTVKTVPLSYQEPNDKTSKVHFVDLAGVETIQRNPRTSFKDQTSQGQANITKTFLEVFALQYQSNRNSRFQEFKNIHPITRYLGKSFSSTSYITLICNIRPHHEDIMITLSVLKFSMALQGIPLTKPKCYLELNQDRNIKNLQEQVSSLKDELLLKNMWGDKCPLRVTQERIDLVKDSVKLFLNGELTELELLSLIDDCSLILNVIKDLSINKDKIGVDNSSVALQTDDTESVSWFSSERRKSGEGRHRIGSSFNKVKSLNMPSPRKVSFEEEPKPSNKSGQKGKSEKSDQSKSKKGSQKLKEEKPILVSEEVQVNLLEPNAKLPNIDSREGLWAVFVIKRPEIQTFLDKLNASVNEADKRLNLEMLTFKNTSHKMRHTQLALNTMANLRHITNNEIYDKDGKIVVLQEESELVKEVKVLQRELDVAQQKVTEAQTDWLDALHKINCEKQLIEEEFKEFCISNNLFALSQEVITLEKNPESISAIDQNVSLQKDSVNKSTEMKTLTIDTERVEVSLQEKYEVMQNKYLKNNSREC